ncbi:MAG: M23 family metallopeptidase [Deltaproteobacteria bacterium]|nr:M23 family metallopeptidase [Deltaproteobacteria bacterium]
MSRPPSSPAIAAAAAVVVAISSVVSDARAQPFTYLPPGDLIQDSGDGRVDDTVYAPGMRFPIENAPAYANSQVYMHGGMYGPGGGQCDSENYSYPWRDNYCEIRSWDMPLCPAGTGHQGQDIRPSTCDNATHPAVATTDGTITHIGTYSVYLTAADGTRYDYLHMSSVLVNTSDEVVRGQPLGMVSNAFGGTPTTIHLHFNIRQNVDGYGSVYVPPYLSLVASYGALLDAPPTGFLDQVSCTSLDGWAFDSDEPEVPVDVVLGFATDGVVDDHVVTADAYRADLCDSLGHCDHGFAVASPLSLFDDGEHAVHASADYETLGTTVELSGSPMTLQCPPVDLSGVRRPVSLAAFEDWAFSAFWDQAAAPTAEVEALPVADDWPGEPEIWTNDDGEDWWLIDDGRARTILGATVAHAWRLDLESAEVRPQSEIDGLPEGPPLRARPVLVLDSEDERFLVDDPFAGSGGESSSGGGGAIAAIPGTNADCGCRAVGQRGGGARGAWLVALFAALASRRARPRANRAR